MVINMKGIMTTVKNDITGGSAVKSMSLIETFGAGAIGAGAELAMGAFLPKLNGWIKPAAEIGIGLIGGALLKNEFGKLLQSGLVIGGMSSFSNFAAAKIQSMIGGGSNDQAQTADTSNTSNTLY